MNACSRKFVPLVVATSILAGYAYAGCGCCEHCGCQSSCRKVCRLVREEKQVEVDCWGCKCEPFCVPGPSQQGCKHCQSVCAECERDRRLPHAEPKRFVWFDWLPGGASIYTRTKLMRKTVRVTVPSYKWVIEDMCVDCTSKRRIRDLSLLADAPAPPCEAIPVH